LWLRRSLTISRRSRAEANARAKCRIRKDKQFWTRGCKTTTQTGNLKYLTEDQFMLERLLETADREMCRAKEADKNLVSLLETLCYHNGSLVLLCNSLSGGVCAEE
jgi:hypothetical protein